MEITGAQIKLFKKWGFDSEHIEGVKHVKVLPYLSIVQSVEGSYDISLGNGETMQTGDGGFFIAPANVQQTIVHHINRETGKMSCRWVFLDIEINNTFPLDLLYQFPVVVRDNRKDELNTLFDRIFASNDIWQNTSDCYALAGCLVKMGTPVSTQTHKRIRNAVSYMKENYRREISVQELSALANMSESNFYAVFKKQMGFSPIAYLNNYRLSIAADKLIDTADTVSEISYSVGIGDPLYFSKLFKKTYDMTPREYRQVYQRKR